MEQTIVITHSGVRGMKWGVRRQQVRRQNLAARRYFKEDRLESSMSKADIIAGRARVSRNRVIRNVALSSIAGSAALGIGVAAMAGPTAAIVLPTAAFAATHIKMKTPYYALNAYRYGKSANRAKAKANND